MIKNLNQSKLLIITLLVLFVAPFLGIKEGFIFAKFFSSNQLTQTDFEIIYSLRIPRTLMAFLAGASLSLAGLCLQTVFQNLLATPYTLGIANSAGFGASLAIVLVSFLPGFAGSSMFSPLVGALGATLLTVLILSLLLKQRLSHSNQAILVIGITINILFTQLTSLVQFLAPSVSTIIELLRWFSGAIPILSYFQILIVLTVSMAISILIFCYSRELDLLYIGREFSLSKGGDPDKTTNYILILLSLLVGVVISFTGPIGFIGVLEPYVCRTLLGSFHKKLIPSTIMLGGTTLIITDLIARSLLYPLEMPVGYLTGVIGGIGIIFILIRGRRMI